MKYNITRNRWSEEHITFLKDAYLQGQPLKHIANRLNRSVSAINKTLARHNLRSHRNQDSSFSSLLKDPFTDGLSYQRKDGSQLRHHIANARHEVSLEGVICWLKTRKVFVIKSLNDNYYEVDGCPMNGRQIVFKANLMREELSLPIFWVSGITHI